MRRKCKFYNFKNEMKDGYLLDFGISSEKTSAGISQYTVGIVETLEGRIEKVSLNKIFLRIEEWLKIDYEIISSGSKGNAVIIDDMLFDCGVSYSKIRESLYNINYLFITHRHTDHLNLTTYQKIRKEFPRIKTIGNYDLENWIHLDEIVGDSTTIKEKDRLIQSFKCVHDVPCSGFVVTKDEKSLIYATDTNSLEHAPKIKYDYFFIESNYDEKKIELIRNNAKKVYGYDAWEGAMRHLSTQQSRVFYYMNRKDKDSLWVELHKSGRFYWWI